MDIVIDASAILAVLVAEPERDRVIELTAGHDLVGPGSLPWEIGNAFTAMLKQDRVSLKQAKRGLDIFQSVPLRYLAVDLDNAVTMAHEHNLYAYDAYFLDCAVRHGAPILTLDRSLKRAAAKAGITTLEV